MALIIGICWSEKKIHIFKQIDSHQLRIKAVSLLVFCSMVMYHPPNAWGQNYLKTSQKSHLFFNQQLIRFDNGDILIGDSFLAPLINSGEEGKVFMTKLDQCGHMVWAYSYSVGPGYLEFRDFLITKTREVITYGSYFNGVRELLFILKFDGQTGQRAIFRLYDPKTTNGYFAYSLNEVDQGFMIYGFLVNPNVGLIAFFDDALNPLWAEKITPFAANGRATITQNKKVLVRSGNYLLSISETGEIDWTTRSNVNIVSGPFTISSGNILVGHQGAFSFFYKIDNQGELIWQSDRFPAVEGSGALSLLNDEHLLFTYNSPDGGSNSLSQLVLTPSGEITEQRQLQMSATLNSGLLTQSIDDRGRITLVGNANPFVADGAEIEDFIMQFSLDQTSNDCFAWQDHQSTITNRIKVSLDFVDLQSEAFDLELLEIIPAAIDTFDYPISDFCDANIPSIVRSRDTVLPCGEAWMVELPDNTFTWRDQSPENPRTLTEPGVYVAVNDDCNNRIELTYRLERDDCGCPVFLPSAFSPNGDGVNDRLILFTECQLDRIQFQVFNRSGEQVFSTQAEDQFWDGRHGTEIAEVGVYVVMVHYSWIDLQGQKREGQMYRDVTLLR